MESEGPILVLLLLHSSRLVPVFFSLMSWVGRLFSSVLGIHYILLGKRNTWSFCLFLFWVFGFRSGFFFFFTIWVGILWILSILVFFFFFFVVGEVRDKRNKNIQISTVSRTVFSRCWREGFFLLSFWLLGYVEGTHGVFFFSGVNDQCLVSQNG